MCEFCENIREYKKDELHCLDDGVLYDTEDKNYLVATNYLAESFEDFIEINFCPICGRKLSEE